MLSIATTRTIRTHVCACVARTVVKRGGMARAAGAAAGCLLSIAAMALLLSLALSGSGDDANIEDALALNEELEFSAIQAVLRHLDDNHDGSVDLQESEEFVQTELKETTERSQKLHETDSQITSEDLWQSWQQNEVFHWTNSDVVHWLLLYVQLPQYRDVFCRLNITGRHLPSLANNSGHMLQTVLGVTDSQHKQKIQLRAMDLVLFGSPSGKSSLWKDIILVVSMSLCLVGVAYALRQRREAQHRIDSFLESFREKESELHMLQERLLEQQKESCEATDGSPLVSPSPSPESDDSLPPLSRNSYSRSSSCETSFTRAQEEIELLRREMADLTSQLASQAATHTVLQGLLQESCYCEREHVERRRREAQDEITRAQKVCDKIKRRRSSLFGTFHLANSSALEEAGLQITRAVNNMHKVSESFEEYHQRWRRIEQVCNFTIVSGHALLFTPPLHHENPAHSLKVLDRRESIDVFSTHSESYSSSDGRSSSLPLTTSDGIPRPLLRKRRVVGLTGSSSLDRDTPVSSSSQSLHSHQYSCPTLGSAVTRGRANTLPPTSSLPRNYSLSGRMLSRHDSYNEAIECSSSTSLDSVGLTMAYDRRKLSGGADTVRRDSERLSGKGSVTNARVGGKESGGRRMSVKRQVVLRDSGLGALHEETAADSQLELRGVEPVDMTTTRVTCNSSRPSQSTV